MSALDLDPLVVARVAGTGNRFLLVDTILGPRPEDPARLARDARIREGLDGVLVVDRDGAGRVRMVIHNADGSRPEACGNGLRCVAAWAARAEHVDAPTFELATDAGVRRARVDGASVEVSMGPARVGAEETLDLEGRAPARGTFVDMGNPHFVLFDVLSDPASDDATFTRLGPLLERHPRFPHGANVEFVSGEPDEPGALRVRVWERGVGETAACGTGACAVAAVAVARGRASWPAAVDLPGGRLLVTDRDGELWLSGAVEIHASDAPKRANEG